MMAAAAGFQGAEDEAGSEEEEEGLCEYDSTWEDEEEEEGREEGRPEQQQEEEEPGRKGSEKPRSLGRGRSPLARQAFGSQEWRRPNRSAMGFGRYKSASRRNWMAARDMQRYRHHYPDLEETDTEANEEEMWNLSFYKNEISFVPHGLHIEDLLEKWHHDYAVMEENHSYIQWLFPLREPGMNWRAKLLTCKEIQAFRKSKEVMDRFVRAYKLMLGFYGIELVNEETGELRRAGNYRERFWNLNQYTHNNLRITRILKCLGEMGKEHYQVHLVKFFLTETLVNQELPRVLRSTLDYFMFTIRNKQMRRELVHFAWQHFQPKHEFVWGPRKKLLEFRPRSPELLNNLAPKEEPEPAKDEKVEGMEQNKSQGPNENVADRPNDNAKKESDSDGDAVETQSMSRHKTPEKTAEPSPKLASNVQAEGKDVKEGSPSKMKPSEKDPTSDCSNGGTDSEYLKESKKRKFGMNKPSRESAGLSRSPTDIEKISSNLEEVVIDQGGPESLPLTEKSTQSMPEGNGGDGQDLKEADLVSAVVKRRKVDEMVPDEKIVEAAAKTEAAVTSFESQIPSVNVPSPEETAEVWSESNLAGVKVSNLGPLEAQSDGRTAGGVDVSAPSEASADHSRLPSGDSEPDRSNECIAASTTEGEETQSCSALIVILNQIGDSEPDNGDSEPDRSNECIAASITEGKETESCSALIASTRQDEGVSGQEEAGMKGRDKEEADLDGTVKALESSAPLAKPEAEGNPR